MVTLSEDSYIRKRKFNARLQSIPFYLFRLFPVRKNKIVFTTIEGTTGFTCNPKYIALEILRRNEDKEEKDKSELIWLVNDMEKHFPTGIRKVRNTLINRAYHLTTARFWIDNSRKQLECRKRKGQIYIQTWHAKLGFKPTCLDRGASFSRIAYLVSKHDSDMIDYWLSNSDWYDKTLKTGSLYEGKTLRTGSPRCDILVNGTGKARTDIRKRYNLSDDAKIIMYAPTFRSGSQGKERSIEAGNHFPDYKELKQSLEERFGGHWYVLLRLHPQLVARNLDYGVNDGSVIDGSRVDDMYELLAGCDAFMTDYSSAAFDAAVMKIPVFLYCDDYSEYEKERGSLLWDLRKLPFPMAETNEELRNRIETFNDDRYNTELNNLFRENDILEDGKATRRVVDHIEAI